MTISDNLTLQSRLRTGATGCCLRSAEFQLCADRPFASCGAGIPASRPLRTSRAFTLVEMLLVLIILGTLAAIVYPNLARHSQRARITATKAQLKVFRTSLAAFEMDNGHFPAGRNGLVELLQRPREGSRWQGPYLDGTLHKDPWGHDYVYECPGKHNPESYDILSLGPDGALGTEDDIASTP